MNERRQPKALTIKNLIGQEVRHKTFGIGLIKSATEAVLHVKYGTAELEKRHVYPDAFEATLVLSSQDLMIFVSEEIARKKAAVAEAETAAREKAAQKAIADEAARQAAAQSARLEKRKRVPGPRKMLHDVKSVAFKCTYCDGGSSPVRLGFNGICSTKNIEHNIVKAKHVWCSQEECDCRQYLDGDITRSRLNSKFDPTPDQAFPCYESAMLRDWRAFAGFHHNGPQKDQPMILKDARKGSLAVLTTREPGKTEAERIVFAVFLVKESYDGDDRQAGYVMADPEFRLELKPEEARKIRFWDYYWNKGAPHLISFSYLLHRYLTSQQAAQILRDIVTVKGHAPDADHARRLYEHFCTMNELYPDMLPDPLGALKRSASVGNTNG